MPSFSEMTMLSFWSLTSTHQVIEAPPDANKPHFHNLLYG